MVGWARLFVPTAQNDKRGIDTGNKGVEGPVKWCVPTQSARTRGTAKTIKGTVLFI